MFDFSFLAPCPASGLIINGAADDVVPPESVKKLVDKLSQQKGIVIDHNIVSGANHFFTNQIDDLMLGINTHMDLALAGRAAAGEEPPKVSKARVK
jgi:alpha/beta superfamily hydrolase